MKVVYRHTFTVVVEGEGNFGDTAGLDFIARSAERDAALCHLFVGRGISEPKPVRSSRVTKYVIVVDPAEGATE